MNGRLLLDLWSIFYFFWPVVLVRVGTATKA